MVLRKYFRYMHPDLGYRARETTRERNNELLALEILPGNSSIRAAKQQAGPDSAMAEAIGSGSAALVKFSL